MEVVWHQKAFQNLNLTELYQLLQLRNEVFIIGQKCVYQDLDGKDKKAIHFFGINESGKMIAYCRLFPPGIYFSECAIGRVLIQENYRRNGLARIMMQQSIRYLSVHWKNANIRISAQLYLKYFYESLGFQQVSETYLEEEIPHIQMLYID